MAPRKYILEKQLENEQLCRIFVDHAVKLAVKLATEHRALSLGRNLSKLASRLNQVADALQDVTGPVSREMYYTLSGLIARLWDMCTANPLSKSPPGVASIISLPGEVITKGLYNFARSKEHLVQHYLNDLELFEDQVKAACQVNAHAEDEPQTEAPIIPEYPPGVDSRLYDTLHQKLRCGCLDSLPLLVESHSGRLRLRCNWQAVEDHVLFDMALSANPGLGLPVPGDHGEPRTIRWRQVRLHIPRRDPESKNTQFVDYTAVTDTGGRGMAYPRTQCDDEVADICRLLGISIGEVRRPFVLRGRKLCQLKPEPVEELISPESSVSLHAALENDWPSKDRAILAYILARSAWQYYRCEWIMDRWEAESIHFMKERQPGGQAQREGYINIAAPYFAFRSPDDTTHPTGEYVDDVSLVHNYPWLVALGVLLVDICRKGRTLAAELSSSDVARMNNRHVHYWLIVKKDPDWPSLGLRNQEMKLEYRRVVERCLDPTIFEKAPTVEERRGIILNEIVWPLRCLLVKMQWLDEYGEARIVPGIDGPISLNQGTLQGALFNNDGVFDASVATESEASQSHPRETFRKLQAVYQDNFQFIGGDIAVKVAILDTGIDTDHPDFKQPRSKMSAKKFPTPIFGEPNQEDRIKGRKNFCGDRDDDSDVEDLDGHGTHVAGIILRLAPRADLYVARVCQGDAKYGRPATDPASQTPSRSQGTKKKTLQPGRVAEAVNWAVGEGVDIINMSFGFDCNALSPKLWGLEAALKRAAEAGVLVLAAASNSGNHRPIAWPARDTECAICVHSCDDFGKYSSRFTPSSDGEVMNFMVLGEDVLSHWPTSKGGGFRLMSGTSTATAIATALVALLLEFTRQSIGEVQREEVSRIVRLERLQSLSGMTALLKRISPRVDGYHWIHSSLLWKEYDHVLEVQQGNPKLAREHAWGVIRDSLRK